MPNSNPGRAIRYRWNGSRKPNLANKHGPSFRYSTQSRACVSSPTGRGSGFKSRSVPVRIWGDAQAHTRTTLTLCSPNSSVGFPVLFAIAMVCAGIQDRHHHPLSVVPGWLCRSQWCDPQPATNLPRRTTWHELPAPATTGRRSATATTDIDARKPIAIGAGQSLPPRSITKSGSRGTAHDLHRRRDPTHRKPVRRSRPIPEVLATHRMRLRTERNRAAHQRPLLHRLRPPCTIERNQ